MGLRDPVKYAKMFSPMKGYRVLRGDGEGLLAELPDEHLRGIIVTSFDESIAVIADWRIIDLTSRCAVRWIEYSPGASIIFSPGERALTADVAEESPFYLWKADSLDHKEISLDIILPISTDASFLMDMSDGEETKSWRFEATTGPWTIDEGIVSVKAQQWWTDLQDFVKSWSWVRGSWYLEEAKQKVKAAKRRVRFGYVELSDARDLASLAGWVSNRHPEDYQFDAYKLLYRKMALAPAWMNSKQKAEHWLRDVLHLPQPLEHGTNWGKLGVGAATLCALAAVAAATPALQTWVYRFC